MKEPSPINSNYKSGFSLTSFLALFSSVGTLVCCALPALLVSIGMGSVFLSLTTAVPQLIWLGEHKTLLFTVSFVLLSASSLMAYINRNAPCPIDIKLRNACIKGRKYTKIILVISWIIFAIGFFFSYLAVYLFY